MPTTTAIRVDDLHKSFGPLEVLKGIDLSVARGEVVVVMGASGSGKTTLLRCINFLEVPDRGLVTVCDICIDCGPDGPVGRSRTRLVRSICSRAMMVFQQFNLFPHKTALQNVIEAPITVRGMTKADATALGERLLDRVGLADKRNEYPSRLSGGQQQRVAIARALAMEPEVVLFDEPTSALDPELHEEVLQTMRELAHDGMTMIVVTHEVKFAQDVADRVVFMDGGVIVEEAPPSEFFTRPRHARARLFLRQVSGDDRADHRGEDATRNEGSVVSTYLRELVCVHCHALFAVGPMSAGCPACRTETFASSVTPTYDYEQLRHDLGGGQLREPDEGLWRYRRLLPVQERRHEVTLGEGGTPLVTLPTLAEDLGAEQVWIKDESRNPTWTFKDRNAAVTVSKAVEFGARAIVVSTSGNYGASIAAYAARAGLTCIALTYPGIPEGTRTLIQAFGARLKVVAPEERWGVMQRGMSEEGWYPASNYTDIPTNGAFGHEGYKTIAYEVTESLGSAPDLVSVPTAYGEGLFGIWKGFDEMLRLGRVAAVPRMLACEPAGGPLALAMADPSRPIANVPRTPTVARGIGGSINSYVSVAALNASNGMVVQAHDESIMAAQRRLAAEGFFVEPASAAALAGLWTLAEDGSLPQGLRIVLVNTSSGLKNLEAFNTAFSDRGAGPTHAHGLDGVLAQSRAHR